MKPETVEIVIDYTPFQKDKSIICYEDFYIKSGVYEYINEMVKANNGKKYHYSNIQANETTINMIDELIEEHLVKTKNKYSKVFKEDYLKTMAAMDRLQWSPKINNTIRNDFIKIILPGNPEYTPVE